jgi:hypothetical protein
MDNQHFIKLTKPRVTTTVIKASLFIVKDPDDQAPNTKFGFNESEMTHKLWKHVEGNPQIIKVESKGIRYIQENQSHKIKDGKAKSNRGRKPSKQTIEKRKRRDDVNVFASQITFIIDLGLSKTITIKVFKNGAVIVPGIQPDVPVNPNLFKSLDFISSIFEKEMQKKISYTIDDISMVYFKLKLENPKLRIKIEDMLTNINKIVEKNGDEKVAALTKEDELEESKYSPEDIEADISAVASRPGKNNISIGIGYIGKKQGKKKYHSNVSIYHTGSINVTGSQKKYNIAYILNWLEKHFNDNIDKLFIYERCKKCGYDDCSECGAKKKCDVCKFCIRCKKYYLV